MGLTVIHSNPEGAGNFIYFLSPVTLTHHTFSDLVLSPKILVSDLDYIKLIIYWTITSYKIGPHPLKNNQKYR